MNIAKTGTIFTIRSTITTVLIQFRHITTNTIGQCYIRYTDEEHKKIKQFHITNSRTSPIQILLLLTNLLRPICII